MLLEIVIDLTICFLILNSLPLLIFSIINKHHNVSKALLTLTIVSIVYFIIEFVLPELLCLGINAQWKMIIFVFLGLCTMPIYLATIIINIVKLRKNKNNDIEASKFKIIVSIIIIVLALPIILIGATFIRQVYLINNSDMLLFYEDKENGGFGDGTTYGYAIKGDSCKRIDLGNSLEGAELYKFCPKEIRKITFESIEKDYQAEHGDYKVVLKSSGFSLYRNEKLIYKNGILNLSAYSTECYYIVK